VERVETINLSQFSGLSRIVWSNFTSNWKNVGNS